MWCTQCGAELREGVSFCAHCGVQVGQAAPSLKPPGRTPASRGRSGIWFSLLAIGSMSLVLMVAAAGAIAWKKFANTQAPHSSTLTSVVENERKPLSGGSGKSSVCLLIQNESLEIRSLSSGRVEQSIPLPDIFLQDVAGFRSRGGLCLLGEWLYLRNWDGNRVGRFNLGTKQFEDLSDRFGSGFSREIGPAVVHGNRIAFGGTNRSLNRKEFRQYSESGQLLSSVAVADPAWPCVYSGECQAIAGSSDSNRTAMIVIPETRSNWNPMQEMDTQMQNRLLRTYFRFDADTGRRLGKEDHPSAVGGLLNCSFDGSLLYVRNEAQIVTFTSGKKEAISNFNLEPSFASLVISPNSLIVVPDAASLLAHLKNKQPRYRARLSNADDEESIKVNGKLVATCKCAQPTSWIDLTPYLRPGQNDLDLIVTNETGGYSWGLEVMRDDEEDYVIHDFQGEAGKIGANANDETRGVVYEKRYMIQF